MKNKKAWLRIIEAFLAILLIIGAVLVVMSRQESGPDISKEIHDRQRYILKIVSQDDHLRQKILSEENQEVNLLISQMIPTNWNFSTNICNVTEACPNPETIVKKQIFTEEILITTDLSEYQPKKLRFFVWLR
ncbi:hypothetical protein GF386_04145 [Candidatus Pacearchaeota archaeon]|nr:hypothetical protein [Candidatus Pacearchaeota archaeon]